MCNSVLNGLSLYTASKVRTQGDLGEGGPSPLKKKKKNQCCPPPTLFGADMPLIAMATHFHLQGQVVMNGTVQC